MSSSARSTWARLSTLIAATLIIACSNAGRTILPTFAASSGIQPILARLATTAGAPRADEENALRRPLARAPSPDQIEDYQAIRTKSVIELQQFRELESLTIDAFEGGPAVATLIDLNPNIGTWYLLRMDARNGRQATYHLESPSGGRLRLDPAYRLGIVIERGERESKESLPCELWPAGAASPLTEARAFGLVYAPLCGGAIYLRNPALGHRTPKEQVVDLLRDHVWRGEQITVLVRDLFYRDAYFATSNLAVAPVPPKAQSPSDPEPPLVNPAAFDQLLEPVNLELSLDGEAAGRVAVGRWYKAEGNPGIFVTTLRPDLVAPEVIEEQRGRVSALDSVESAALAFLVAFDLEQFDLGFRVGTDHPRVGWSDTVLKAVRGDSTTGPDGIDSLEPLVRTGMLSPDEVTRVAATFTGGFKRAHGAFSMSSLATIASGSHYGFVENGVVLSKLQAGLATAVVFDDGSVDLRTWSEADDALLSRIRYARQNGVPILEREAGSNRSVPGSRVRDWGAGNWSGSADRKLRTLRAGLCLQESLGRRFLIYGYFSSATPSSMARVFQAAGCRYAMLLDMNALEHTYMAIYRTQGGTLLTQHLIDGMGVVDGSRNGKPLPRFVSVADNRDFFYLLRRNPR